MAYLGTKPANQVIDSTLIADGTITPADLSTGKPVWDTSGNVGIGTSSPVYKLDVRTSVDAVQIVATNGTVNQAVGYCSAGQAIVGAISNHPYVFLTNNTERMRIDGSGNLGIGTNSPSSFGKFVVKQSADTSIASLGVVSQASSTDTFISIGYHSTSDTARLNTSYISTGAFKPLSFWTSDTERMRIDSSGNLLVGATSRPAGVSGGMYVSTGGLLSCARYQGYSNSVWSSGFNVFWTGSAAQLYIDSSNVGTITLSSDYRIKRNIQTQTAPALERVMALRPVTYQMADYGTLFKATEDIKEGFIAHEVQEVIPSGAEGVKDDPEQIQSLRVDAILAVAVKAIQELKAELDTVKSELQALKE